MVKVSSTLLVTASLLGAASMMAAAPITVGDVDLDAREPFFGALLGGLARVGARIAGKVGSKIGSKIASKAGRHIASHHSRKKQRREFEPLVSTRSLDDWDVEFSERDLDDLD